MAVSDRNRWNEKYQCGEHASTDPSRLITSLDHLLPRAGRTVDVAGGAGRNAIWLAQRGLSVTLADISDEALEIASTRAVDNGLDLQTLQIDFEQEPFPSGPWDLILCMHYLWRPLFDHFRENLSLGGLLILIHPTHTNLQRHKRPSARFLLDDGELPSLVSQLEIVKYEESWLVEGRHEARLVARRAI